MANAHYNGDNVRYLKNDATQLMQAITLTADDYSETFNVGQSEKFGIAVSVTTVSGTSHTLDISAEWSPDGGTTWFEYPNAIAVDGMAAGKQAVVTQLTTSGAKAIILWETLVPQHNCSTRFKFDVGGTGPSFTGLSAWLLQKKTAVQR